jgi:hypothetical protein
VDSLSGHDPLTTHLVESVLTFKGSRVGAVLGSADSDTELVCSHVADCQYSFPLSNHLRSRGLTSSTLRSEHPLR